MDSKYNIMQIRLALAKFYAREYNSWADCFARSCPRTALALLCCRALHERYPDTGWNFDLGLGFSLARLIEKWYHVEFPDLEEMREWEPEEIFVYVPNRPRHDPKGFSLQFYPECVALHNHSDSSPMIHLEYGDPALVDRVEEFFTQMGCPVEHGQ